MMQIKQLRVRGDNACVLRSPGMNPSRLLTFLNKVNYCQKSDF